MAARSSDWLTQRSGVDDAPAHQLDTPASWDSEPQLWQDVLTEQLWQIFAGTHNKGERPQHTREPPAGEGPGGWGGRGLSRGSTVEPCPPVHPPPPPFVLVTEQAPGLVSDWYLEGWASGWR